MLRTARALTLSTTPRRPRLTTACDGRPVLAVRRRLLCRRLRHVGCVHRRGLRLEGDEPIVSELRRRLSRPGLGKMRGVRDGHVQLNREPAHVRACRRVATIRRTPRPRQPRHGGRLRAVPERAFQRRAGRRDVRGVRQRRSMERRGRERVRSLPGRLLHLGRRQQHARALRSLRAWTRVRRHERADGVRRGHERRGRRALVHAVPRRHVVGGDGGQLHRVRRRRRVERERGGELSDVPAQLVHVRRHHDRAHRLQRLSGGLHVRRIERRHAVPARRVLDRRRERLRAVRARQVLQRHRHGVVQPVRREPRRDVARRRDGVRLRASRATTRTTTAGALTVTARRLNVLEGTTKATLNLNPGYYRASGEVTVIRLCPGQGCRGGADPSNYCHRGYHGPLCAACDHGYHESARQCEKCNPQSFLPLLLWVSLAVALAAVTAHLRRRFAAALASTCGARCTSTSRSCGARCRSCRSSRRCWRVSFRRRSWRCATSCGSQPLAARKSGARLRLAVALRLRGSFALRDHHPGARRAGARRKLRVASSRQVRGRAGARPRPARARLGLLLCYLVLPSTTTTIFQSFLCDHDFGIKGTAYLVADYDVECGSETHRAGAVLGRVRAHLPCRHQRRVRVAARAAQRSDPIAPRSDALELPLRRVQASVLLLGDCR